MGELVEKFEQRGTKGLGGAQIEVFGENNLAGSADQIIRFSFTQGNKDYTIFSVVVELIVYAPRGFAYATVQTDFNIYPYADLSSFGIINTGKFTEMMEIARQNCMRFAKHYCDTYGYGNEIFEKEKAKVLIADIKPISDSFEDKSQ